MYLPASPLWVLQSVGIPTCCVFSNSETYLLIGGTAEGNICMWDLREKNSIHKSKYIILTFALLHSYYIWIFNDLLKYCRDSLDMGIERGIRKPCFVSHCRDKASMFYYGEDPLLHRNGHTTGEYDLDIDHTTTIVQVYIYIHIFICNYVTLSC
jgi:hypothetical protein